MSMWIEKRGSVIAFSPEPFAWIAAALIVGLLVLLGLF